jgi:predicted RNA-binding protein with EMAP domain
MEPNPEKRGDNLTVEEQEEKNEKSENKEKDKEIEQGNIAHEYLQEYKHHQKLMESYQDTLRSLDKLRKEFLSEEDLTVKKLQGELKSISAIMGGSQDYMNSLFNQLSDESKEKYLKS